MNDIVTRLWKNCVQFTAALDDLGKILVHFSDPILPLNTWILYFCFVFCCVTLIRFALFCVVLFNVYFFFLFRKTK